MTRLLAATLAAALLACLLGGCSVGCWIPDCTVTTTDGVTVTGEVCLSPAYVYVKGDFGELELPEEKVLRIERTPQADTRRAP